MTNQPCNVCGNTDLNLIDGFYYCVECGTQDVNVRETIVEQTYLADGTLALVGGKKFSIAVKDGMQMSGEWHKWHAYNFILAGLTDELINLGAKPSVKMKVLWIWTRYIQKFQVKEDLDVKSKIGNDSLGLYSIHQLDTDNSEPEEGSEEKQKKSQSEKFTKDIKYVTKGLLLAILYVALNLDKSNIQLSHLFRFITEGRLSFLNCNKYIPKEIDTKSIPHWKSFTLCQSDYNSFTIRAYAMACVKTLDLGLPFVPDINKIINNYIKELCLPDDFKDLVLSLMLCHPCDHLDIDKVTQKVLVRVPDYEGVTMSYILVALKMCFGLDGDYEERISDAVDNINYEENHMKSHKLGMFSDRTDRLFSFREWIRFLQFRRTILSQHYLPMARQYNQEVDDCVLMEQLEERPTRPIKLSDEVTMDILNKIPLKNDINVIPKTQFVACLTPMSNYTDVILNYVQDNELRLLLSEDFTQYSLKFATENLMLLHDGMKENLIVGVSGDNKMVQLEIEKYFKSKKGDMTMVFVRNCENKNWLKTNPPKAEHVTIINENDSTESDLGYDSHIENSPVENSTLVNDDSNLKLVCLEGDKGSTNIFDDNFLDVNKDTMPEQIEDAFDDDFNINRQEFSKYLNGTEDGNDETDFTAMDKAKIIKELISLACKKYKITMPKEYIARDSTRKRKSTNVNKESGEGAPKTKRVRPNEAQGKINDMIAAYYNHIDNSHLTNALKSLHDPEFDQLDCNSFSFSKIPALPTDGNENSNVDLNEISPTLNPCVETEEQNVTDKTEVDEQADGNKEIDSKFDEKTHNIEQLYVKLKEDVAIGDFSLDEICDDPDVDKIITSKIEQFHNYDNDVCVKNEKEEFNGDDEEASDIQEMEYKRQNREKQKELFEPLAKIPEKPKRFKYWLRHYCSRAMGKNLEMRQKFDAELKEKFPASFSLIMNECCAILGCSAFVLYKYMQNLEEIIVAKAKQVRVDED